MKKRVRIYKPTNRFQEGGEQGMQFTPDQLVSIYMTALSEPGSTPDIAENALRQIGVDEQTIAQISESAGEYIDEQQYLTDATSTADEDALADITADQAAIDAAAESERSALELAEEEARSDAMQQMYADYNEPDYGDDTDMADQIVSRYGGTPSKRNFVKNITKQFKKQLGGPSESATVDSTDPENKRKDKLMSFIGAVQEDADTALMRKDAEEMYKMLTTPIGQDESYYQDEDMDYAQFGGMRRGRARRMDRRLNRMVRRMPIGFAQGLPGVYTYPNMMPGMMPGMFPMMPAEGSVYGGPRLANIDVRRTGLFGRPKEYSITFDNDVITNPQIQEDIVKQEVKNKEQEVKDESTAAEEGTVDKGVEEKKQAEADAAAQAAEEAAVDINDIQVVSGKAPVKGGSGKAPVAKGKTDKWGRSADNKWYGFDPATKKWTLGTPDWAKKSAPAKKTTSPKQVEQSKKLDRFQNMSTDELLDLLEDPSLHPEAEFYARRALDQKRKQQAFNAQVAGPKKAPKENYKPLVKGTSYTLSDNNSRPLPNVSKGKPTDREVIQALEDYSRGKVAPQQIKEPTYRDYLEYFMPGWFGSESPKIKLGTENNPKDLREIRVVAKKSKQFGGMTDQDSGLFRFIYGGDEDSKLTNDPYFAYGGLTKYQDKGEVKALTSEELALAQQFNINDPGFSPEGTRAKIKQMQREQWIDQQMQAGNLNDWPTGRRVDLRQPNQGGFRVGDRVVYDQNRDDYSLPYNNPYIGNTYMGGYSSYGMPTLSTRQRRMPYMTGTGQTYTGDLANAKVAKIDVKKTRAFGPYKGMPKKYTINYQVERDPLSKRLSFDDSGMRVDGQSMSDIAPTRNRLFNRDQGAERTLADRMIDTGIRPISWLGSKLKPFGIEPEEGRVYTPEEQRMLRKGFDPDTGLTQDELARKREREAITDETFAFDQSQALADINPEDYPMTDMSQMQNYPLRPMGLRDIKPLETGVERPEIIPMNYEMPVFRNELEEAQLVQGEEGPMPEMYYDMQEQPDQGIDLLGMPTVTPDYSANIGDQNILERQQQDIQRMIEQNPEFYNQPQYNWQPGSELLGSANTPILTPQEVAARQQEIIAQQREAARRRAAAAAAAEEARRQAQQPQRQVATQQQPAKKQEPVSRVEQRPVRTEQQPIRTEQPVVKSETKKTETKVEQPRKQEVAPVAKQEKPQSKYYSVPGEELSPIEKQAQAEKAQRALSQQERQIKQGQEKILQESRNFKDTYGVAKTTYNMYLNAIKEGDKQTQKVLEQNNPALKSKALQQRLQKDRNSKAYGGYMQHGGTLPQAFIGEDTPIDQDERFQPRNTNFDLGSTDLTNPFLYSGRNPFTGQESGVRMGTEGEYVNEGLTDELPDFSDRKEYDDVSVDYNTRQKMSGAQRRMYLDVFNTGADKVLNWANQLGNADSDRRLKERLLSEGLYGSTRQRNRGWIDTNSGKDIAALYGQIKSGSESKYGGGVYQLGGVTYKVGHETYMSPKQIADYIAKGGEIEFI